MSQRSQPRSDERVAALAGDALVTSAMSNESTPTNPNRPRRMSIQQRYHAVSAAPRPWSSLRAHTFCGWVAGRRVCQINGVTGLAWHAGLQAESGL